MTGIFRRLKELIFNTTWIGAGVLGHVTLKDTRANNATRLYMVPNGNPGAGTLSALKLFGTDYEADQINYQDFGVYLSKKVVTATSVDTTGDTVGAAGHGFGGGDLVRYETTGTPIGGLAANGSYYVVYPTAGTFALANTAGGAAIDLTFAGTGTHSFTKVTAYLNGKVNGNYPQYSLAHSFQDGAQVGVEEFPVNTGAGQKMHVALGGGKPSYSVWYDGVRIHLTTDTLSPNGKMQRWMNAEGTSAGFGTRVTASNDWELLVNSVVVAAARFGAGSPVFELVKPLVKTRTVGTIGDTTPNVAGIPKLQIPSSPTPYNVTDFLGAKDDQELEVLFSDSNCTLKKSAGMRLAGGVDFVSSSGAILVLTKSSSCWYEKSRSVNPP